MKRSSINRKTPASAAVSIETLTPMPDPPAEHCL
jgi:hypothetical protein